MRFDLAVRTHFPGAMPMDEFVDRLSRRLESWHGFARDNTLACVGLCRDERCRPFSARILGIWGEAFEFGALAGMLWLGRAGFNAARSHAPMVDGRQHYLFAVLPHIGIGPGGEIGMADAAGRPRPAEACGALIRFLHELESGRVDPSLDRHDVELSLLKQRLIPELDLRQLPDLVELTRVAHRAALADLEMLAADAVDPSREDYAVLSGILIHGPDATSLVWPGPCYAVVAGTRTDLLP